MGIRMEEYEFAKQDAPLAYQGSCDVYRIQSRCMFSCISHPVGNSPKTQKHFVKELKDMICYAFLLLLDPSVVPKY